MFSKWLPMTALAVWALTTPTHAETTPADCPPGKFCICTGSPQGDYQKSAEEISRQVGGRLGADVVYVHTNGSQDNFNLVAEGRACKAGFVQSDVYDMLRTEVANAGNVTVVQPLYTEYTHILCPAAARIGDLDDLARAHAQLIIGPPGSGTAETWRSLRQVDERKYGGASIPLSPDPADASSITAVKNALKIGKTPTCLLWISGLNATPMQDANAKSIDPATNKPSLQLISVDDSRMARIPGANGPRYAVKEIRPQAQFYDHLINNGWLLSHAGVDVLAVQALFVLNKPYQTDLSSRNRAAYTRLTTAVEDAAGVLSRQMSPGE